MDANLVPAPAVLVADARTDPATPVTMLLRRGNHFKRLYAHQPITLDAARELLPAPAIRATARWNPPMKTGFSRSVLLPADDGRALVGNTFVKPPHNFRVYLTLIGTNDQVLGSYTLDFKT